VLQLREIPSDQLATRTADLVDRTAPLRAAARYLELDESRRQVEEVLEATRERAALLDVTDGDATVGFVWLTWGGSELVVSDLSLDDPERVAELVPLLVDRARDAGLATIGVGIFPGEPNRVALGAQPGFTSRATNMALPLDGEIGDPGELELHPMTEAEFDDFLSGNAEEYAAELAAAGMTEEAAAQQSQEQMAALIPDGLASPGMYFFTGRVADRPVGVLWLCGQDPMAFVYDVAVEESERRKGYGAAIMNAGARWSRDHGHPALGLNVFAHNPSARALYDRLGYQVTQDYHALDVSDAR
jgi:GNAT superfamily N-acetyltransferase